MKRFTAFLMLLIFAPPLGALSDEAVLSCLVCVNKDHALPEDYVPPDLRKVDIPFMKVADPEREMLRDEAATALEAMFGAAAEEGLTLRGISGYRSYASQSEIYRRGSNSGATDDYIAEPGHSEHQTGLAMDIGTGIFDRLTEAFAKTDEAKWVFEHAHEYGYIIRYPKGAESITGYEYEPWHIRYVGDAAVAIYEEGITLEEYFSERE